MTAAASAATCCRRTPARAGRRVRGVSLLEMLLVLVLIAAITLLAAMAMNGGLDGVRLRSSAKELAAQLRYTRTQAIVTGAPQRFDIDPQQRRWQAPNGRHGQLPAALSVSFRGAGQAQPQAGVGGIAFFEDGAATGGRIELALRQSHWRIEVNWITGEVTSAPVPADGAR